MILHVMIIEKFMPPFIDFMMEHFDVSQHRFVFITSPKYQYGLQPHHPVEFLYRDEDFITLSSYFDSADKIILHGLWRDKVNYLLVQERAWLDKSFWVMWGGDFYYHEQYDINHIKVINNVAGLISYVPGDIKIVRDKYMAQGRAFSCFFYPSNIYHGPYDRHVISLGRDKESFNIMLGHSGVIENDHVYWINYLADYTNAVVFSPLAYPKNSDYVTDVIAIGKTILGSRFQPMLDFVTREKYESFLDGIDFAIMPSWRQHGMGNLISLLGRGIPVAMHAETTSRHFFLSMGVDIFSLDNMRIALDNISYQHNNAKLIQSYFSVEQLANDWRVIFNS